MSMSTLGAQLSALSSTSAGGASAGTTHSTSRVTNDGVGRGFHHSSQHGHSIARGGGSVTRVPSVLFENAREAADVTLVTLRENAVGAWETLRGEVVASAAGTNALDAAKLWNSAEFIGSRGLLSTHNLDSFERGTTTSKQNLQLDSSIKAMLGLLMTLVAEHTPPTTARGGGHELGENSILLACLHVVEYLLRKYQILTRPQTAEALLTTFLPLQICYPSSYPQLFARLLSLVDLQSVPQWTFLRPYAARGAPPLGRVTLSKAVARNEALVRIISGIGRRGMEISLSENGETRRGISTLLSFSASVLVEALHLQSTNKDAGVGGVGGVKEGTVRVLFPLVMSACKSGGGRGCPEWKEWGRLLASTLATICPLSEEVKLALCDAVVDGVPLASGNSSGSRSDSIKLSVGAVDDASSAIMTLLSILGSMDNINKESSNDDEDNGWEYYLPMLPPSKKKRRNLRSDVVVDYVGCELPPSTYQRLSSKGEVVPMAMGAIIQSLECEDEEGKVGSNLFVEQRIAPLAASLIAHSFRTLEKEAREIVQSSLEEGVVSSSKKKNKGRKSQGGVKAEGHMQLILSLIKESSLSTLWGSKRSAFVAAVTVETIVSYNGLHQSLSSDTAIDDQAAKMMKSYASILSALSNTDSAVHDQALAYAINTTASKKENNGKDIRMARLAQLLGRFDIISSLSTEGAKTSGKDGDEDIAKEENMTHVTANSLLPARVALEHADASIRLSAVARLKTDIESNDREEVASIIDGDLGHALLRRLGTDDDAAVASAAGEIIEGILKQLIGRGGGQEDMMEVDNSQSSTAILKEDFLATLAGESLASLLRWTFIGGESDVWSPPACCPAQPASTAARKKKKKSKDASPLLVHVRICGSVAKLILNRIRNDDGDLEDSHPLTTFFFVLFLSLGAHVRRASNISANETSHFIETVSDAASNELLQLSSGGGSIVNVADLITTDSISQKVLTHFYSNGSQETSAVAVPTVLRSRFLWLAMNSYSDLLPMQRLCDKEKMSSSSSARSRILQITLGLTLNLMECAGNDGQSFLRESCASYLSSVQEERDLFERAIMKLASTTSEMSFLGIAKPEIATVVTKFSPASGENLSVLLHACLRSDASTKGVLRILDVLASYQWDAVTIDSQAAVRDCILPTLGLLSHSDRKVRERAIKLLELYPSKFDKTVINVCGKGTDRSLLVMDGADALPGLLSQISLQGHVVSSSFPSSAASPALRKILIESCKSCALKKENNGNVFNNGGCQVAAVILSSMEKAGEVAFPLSHRWELAGKELFQAFLRCEEQTHDEQQPVVAIPSVCRLRDTVLSMLKGVLVNEAQSGSGNGLNIQISIGPSSTGRRVRSYSIGASDVFTTLEPYPETMMQSLLEALSPSSDLASTPPLDLSKHLIQSVILRSSWSNGVFPKLSAKFRNAVTSALLALRTLNDDESAGRALLGLPLKSPDLLWLIKGVGNKSFYSEIDQTAVVIITDCVRGKLDALGRSGGGPDISKLSSRLFDHLLALSSVKKSSGDKGVDSGSRDYTRVSILQTLFAIHSQYQNELVKESDSKKHGSSSKKKRRRSDSNVSAVMASRANLLVGLLGGNASIIHSLNSGRGRSLTLSLLTCLCEESPSAVVTSLLPALMSLAGASPTSSQGGKNPHDESVDTRALGDALIAIVPAYCTHAPTANLTLFNLLESFVGRIIVQDYGAKLLDYLVDALKLLPTKGSSSNAVASLAACVLALQAFAIQKPKVSDSDSEMLDDADRPDLRVLANATSGIKITVYLSLLQYAEKLMLYVCGLSSLSVGDEISHDKMKADTSQLVALALRGPNTAETSTTSSTSVAAYSKLTEAQQRSILYLAINLLQSVRSALSTPAAKRIVRKSKGDDAGACLRLWNELMQTHESILSAKHSKLAHGHALSSTEKRFWDAVPIATSECLDSLQNLLPVPHFLASVSAILMNDDEENGTHVHKKKIIKLLADRVAEVSCDSPEALLFLEMVPDLVSQINLDPSTMAAAADVKDSLASSLRHTIVMQQGALIAIESFARALYPSTENGKLAARAAAVFLPALASVTKLLDHTATAWIKSNGGNAGGNEISSSGVIDAHCQLLSSSSLCVSTLVTTLKARCLPQLPTIIKPLVRSLKSVNVLLGGVNDPAASSTGELLQLSILKTLQAIAETIPQFLLPYLPLIFSDNGLPSKSLRKGYEQGDHPVRTAVVQVETAVATKVQVRQLIPAISQALSKNLRSEGSENWEEAYSILNVMAIAVEASERSELSPITGKIFNGLVMAYGYEGDDDSTPQILRGANKCLLSLVMKLSEAQLRPLYARLREWRGDIEDGEDGSVSSSARRYAFWSLSAELSKSLRSIFLPCLTSVLTDLIDELEIAVTLLCRTKKKAGTPKRRRVEETDSSEEDMEKVKSLQPLLLCLESALKADAHEGGEWTRGDDNQRYNMILNHLGKLLLAQIPKETALLSDLTPKEQASTSAYQQLIQGVGTLEHGNVVGCLTSLAAAAGNEQLWKPLNFAVLEACSNGRNEVRKAGIGCLLSIIESIGEEYMVLLPECLPVISELLEDDEEIAAMAKDCVRQGEELLGESLEDSLR